MRIASSWLVDIDESVIVFKDEALGTHLDLVLEAKTPELEFGHLGQIGGVKGGGTDQMTLSGGSPRPRDGRFHTVSWESL